jgi:polyphenol oxidase
MTLDITRAAALSAVPHAFLGRTGGVSTGIYASLNVGLGSNDDKAAVRENRARATAAIGCDLTLVTVHQVHSAEVVDVPVAWPDDARPPADGMVTSQRGLALGILTADCAPVLFADAEAGVIGAAHAGWKGAFTGVLANTVAAMERLGARRDRIAAAIGPCIARRSYEVDDAFYRRFVEADGEYDAFFTPGRRAERHQFDLEGFVARRLADVGVATVEALGEDTYAQPERYFSYRRTTHAEEPDYGRQLSLIALG